MFQIFHEILVTHLAIYVHTQAHTDTHTRAHKHIHILIPVQLKLPRLQDIFSLLTVISLVMLHHLMIQREIYNSIGFFILIFYSSLFYCLIVIR